MRRFIRSSWRSSWVLAGIVAVSATAVWAQDSNDQTAAVSEANVSTVNNSKLNDEGVSLKPQVGFLNFKDSTGSATNRGAVGLALEMNFSRFVAGGPTPFYFGLSTGGLYSHLGDAGSNFFGTNANISTGTSGSNLALFPVNGKIGYNITDSFRIAAHGGGNVIYTSIPSSFATELGSSASNNWNIFPNVGGDVDFGLSRNVALTLRPDWTFTPGVGFFTGTLELGIALG